MSAGQLATLISAVAGLVTAIGAVLAVVRHQTGPAHQQPPAPAPGPRP